MTVLHYKTNFLNPSETFIKRVIQNHHLFKPVGMCVHSRSYIEDLKVYKKPQRGISYFVNSLCFHLNWCLPFYIDTIQKVRPDIIHAHFGYDGYRMIKPSKKAGIPLVVSFYGSDVGRLPSEFDWKRRYRKLARAGDHFIAASSLMKEQLIDLGFPSPKIDIVRFGLDLNKFQFNANYTRKRRVMIVGRMVEKKGFIHALTAVKMLKDQGISIEMDLYGDGPLREKLQQKANYWGINEHVNFHGYQPIDIIRRAYHSHSILLVPSMTASDGDQEGIPNTLLEGMASGIPVIAAAHSAIPEVITHQYNGFLFDEGRAKQIVAIIKTIKSGQVDLSTIRQQARAHIEQHYSISRMVQKVEDIYKKVLS